MRNKDGLRRPSVDVDDLPNWRPAVTLTFDLKSLIRSSVGDSEYTASVLSKLFEKFMRYLGNNIWLDKQMDGRTNVADRQPKIIMSLITLMSGEGMITQITVESRPHAMRSRWRHGRPTSSHGVLHGKSKVMLLYAKYDKSISTNHW